MGARRTHPVKLIVSCLTLGLMLALAVTVLSRAEALNTICGQTLPIAIRGPVVTGGEPGFTLPHDLVVACTTQARSQVATAVSIGLGLGSLLAAVIIGLERRPRRG
ncbi:hypothetical protein [Nostocoides veronense]|uniref:Uncharacterized protein n=1 Tax=Nostocoides veronense TaxID=330836 RepID=A0ABP4XLA5_9MICO